MRNNFDINEFIFSKTKGEKKLEVLDSLSNAEIRKATNATMLKIYNACRNGRDRFYIDSDRRAGNDWNSTIEFLFEYKGNACLMMYIQNTKTDSSDSVCYNEFNRGSSYSGYCDYLGTRYTYNADKIAGVIRCILKEYVYYTDIERKEREQRELLKKVADYPIINPVFNEFYEELDLWHKADFRKDLCEKYENGKAAVNNYAKEHVAELVGKTKEELQAIYRKIFRAAM